MLDGKVITRKTLGERGLADNNDSLHSYVSYLYHTRHIPIEREKNDDGTMSYFIRPAEIYRYRDPELRKKQIEEIQGEIEVERQKKLIEQFVCFLTNLDVYPVLWRYWSGLPHALDEISWLIDALLNGKKSDI